MKFKVGQKWRGTQSGKIFEITAVEPSRVKRRYLDGSEDEWCLSPPESITATLAEDVTPPRLPKPGETWRLKDSGRLIENLREDGALLFSRDNLPYTADWLALNATLVSEDPPADPRFFKIGQRWRGALGTATQIATIVAFGDDWIEIDCPESNLRKARFLKTDFKATLVEEAEPMMVPVKVGGEIRHIPVTAAEPMQSPRLPPFAEMVLRHQELAGYPMLTDDDIAAFKNTVERETKTGRYASEKPAPRAHDFSNPYLVNDARTGRRCVECGFMLHEAPACEPRPGWRELDEDVIGKVMATGDMVIRGMNALFGKPPAAPYRNDVAGIGATLGGYLNVAPERGR